MPIPSSPTEQQKLKAVLQELQNCLTQIDSQREAMKEILSAAEKDFEIPKKHIRKVAVVMHKANYRDVQEDHEGFELLYETLVEGRKIEDINSGIADLERKLKAVN